MIQRNGLKKKKKKKRKEEKRGRENSRERKNRFYHPERRKLILGLRQTSRNRIAHAFNFTRGEIFTFASRSFLLFLLDKVLNYKTIYKSDLIPK